jgi:hypothetical protein
MHDEILTTEQGELLPVIQKFQENFGLVGGTAIALYIGHRESIDFDLFSHEEFEYIGIRQVFYRAGKNIRVLRNNAGEFTFVVDGVNLTFFQFPYPIEYTESFKDIVKLPTLVTLAAMKAFALGRRNKWKDYVDLYFIMRDFHPLKDIVQKASQIFAKEFNEKLFRQQLAYFEDIDYREQVTFKSGFEVGQEEIKERLIELSLS